MFQTHRPLTFLKFLHIGKIGKFLYLNAYIYASGLSGGQGNIRLGGLPFGIKTQVLVAILFLWVDIFIWVVSRQGLQLIMVRWQANASPVTHLDFGMDQEASMVNRSI